MCHHTCLKENKIQFVSIWLSKIKKTLPCNTDTTICFNISMNPSKYRLISLFTFIIQAEHNEALLGINVSEHPTLPCLLNSWPNTWQNSTQRPSCERKEYFITFRMFTPGLNPKPTEKNRRLSPKPAGDRFGLTIYFLHCLALPEPWLLWSHK